jgi:hypothetical protein
VGDQKERLQISVDEPFLEMWITSIGYDYYIPTFSTLQVVRLLKLIHNLFLDDCRLLDKHHCQIRTFQSGGPSPLTVAVHESARGTLVSRI